MDYSLLYCTFPSLEAAQGMAHRLLEERLIACANILPPIESLYRWEGKVVSEPEIVMLCKTQTVHHRACAKLIEAHHPYDCPAIIALPMEALTSEFAAWVDGSVASMPKSL